MNRPNQSEETIISVSKTTLNSARENLAALSEFGLTEEMLNQFEADIQVTEALPDEISNRIELKSLTVDKDDALNACYQWGRRLRARLQLAFGRGSSQLRSFPSDGFNNAVHSEKNMMPIFETLIKLANQYNAELTAYGQTPEILAEGSRLLEALRTMDAAQEIKKDEKKSATQTRYQKFETIYNTVNRINRIGRLLFETDPVHLALFESKWAKSAAYGGDQEVQ
ncbi:hypothetical protein HQ585_13975 [candidate division KSB1 bacterium]|nr:hypothetical protein [candidate division KSB1 bacterium]